MMYTEKYDRFNKLSWLILECKYCYYLKPEYDHLSDLDYDKVELEYRKLAEELGVKASACDMVGFDLERASCRLVVSQVDRIRSVNFSLLSL